MLKHIFQSRRESAALNNAVLARLQRVARDYSAVSEVVAEVERSSLSLLSDKRILEMMLCLCETELACPSPSIGPLLSATARLLGARGLYALLPRHPLQPLLRGCLPPPHGVASAVGEGPTRLGALLDLVLAIVRLPDASGDADEKLERAARAHFHLCGGAAALASLVGSLGTAAPRLRSLRREVGEPLLEILVSLLSTREASTEYGLTLSLCDGLSPQALDQLEIGGDRGRYGGDRPQALDHSTLWGCALSFWGIGSSVNSSRAARRSPCCGCAATHAARCGGARRRCCRRRCSSATRRSTFSEPSRNLPPGGAARVRRGAAPRRPALRRPLRRGCRGPPLPCEARSDSSRSRPAGALLWLLPLATGAPVERLVRMPSGPRHQWEEAPAARKTKAKSVRIESPRGEGGEGAALPEDEACRRLVGLLCDCCPPALGQLGRMVPPALVERRLERPPPELVNEFGQR